jgi:hypothetical protein
MSEHQPGAKPIDPDSTEPLSPADEVKKRELPGMPLGPEHPEKPEGVPAQDGE